CSSCGAAYSGEVSHAFDDNSQKYDEENHWLECIYCHEKQNVFSHYNSCVDAEHCVACGAPYKGSEGGQHVGDSSKSGHNETHHWVGCAYCDGYAVYVEHFNTCGPNGNSTECVCGYPYSGFVKHFYKEGVCTRCGEAEPHEHSWTLVSTIDATCESAGVKEYKCACGETKRETYSSATGHDWVTTNQAATCQEAGYEKTACTRCGQFTQTEIPALFHNWKQSEKVAADCTKAGYIKYTCTNCGYFKKDVIPSVGHNFGEYKASGNGIHFAECQNGCGEKLEGACTYQETDAGKTCSVCEDVIAATPVPAQESTPAPAEDAGLPNAEPVIIEEAALESAAENVLPEKAVDVELIVEEQPELTPDNEEIQQALAEQPAALQELIITTVEENPEAVILNITLVVDEEKVEPKGTLRISLPAEKLQGMRLVYLTGDGMMVEIEFEIVDGKAIFETDVLGFFALIPV
ncbi:MAG: hypothetical protein IJE17_10550, partial [Clostridia bacterium]|nr:hypothetical protein [Clostridia bacterium]